MQWLEPQMIRNRCARNLETMMAINFEATIVSKLWKQRLRAT